MSPFRRKRDGEGDSSDDTVQAQAAPGADEPDPAAWALPADAGAVTTDAGTAATAAAAEPEPESAPASSGWAPPPSAPGQDPLEAFNEVAERRPELVVAGTFAGAFVFARILKRITRG